MACVNLAMDVIDNFSERRGNQGAEGHLIKSYRASELIPAPEPPLHKLLKREPGVWAAFQLSSGVLSMGLGVMFAASFKIEDLLLTLFRVPIVSGLLFVVAGFCSLLLYRQPALLQMCFHANIFTLAVAGIGAVLLMVDLGIYKEEGHYYWQVEILLLCVTLLDMLVSIILILLIKAEKRRHQKE